MHLCEQSKNPVTPWQSHPAITSSSITRLPKSQLGASLRGVPKKSLCEAILNLITQWQSHQVFMVALGIVTGMIMLRNEGIAPE
jgi:hypothetical protein